MGGGGGREEGCGWKVISTIMLYFLSRWQMQPFDWSKSQPNMVKNTIHDLLTHCHYSLHW